MSIHLRVKKLHPAAVLPKYATDGAACFDLHALIEQPVQVSQDHPAIIPTGLAFEVPEGYALMLYSRSGHGFKSDIRLANAVGVLDSDYRGEAQIKLAADGAPFTVMPNDRIAQAMVVAVPKVVMTEANSLSTTERGTGGLGSTGQ